MATNSKGVEAWWGFMAGAIIVIAVVVVLLVMYTDIGKASMASVNTIGDKIGKIFQ